MELELIIFIVVFFVARYIVLTNKPELKGFVNGTIFFPLLSLTLSFVAYNSSSEIEEETLPRIDSLRKVSTYSPYFGEEVDMAVRYAQDYGYMSDEIAPRSSNIENAFQCAFFANITSIISIILSFIWIYFTGKLVFEFKNKKIGIKTVSLFTFISLATSASLCFKSISYIMNHIGDNYNGNEVIGVYVFVAIGLNIWFIISFDKTLKRISSIDRENKKETEQ